MLHVAVAALIVVAELLVSPSQVGADSGEVQQIGAVRMPFRAEEYAGGNIIGLDVSRRRMYYFWLSNTLRLHASEYALSGSVPTLLRDRELGPGGVLVYDSYNTAIDPVRRRAFQVQSTSVTVIDLAALSVTATWSLAERIPGFSALGSAYSPQDRKLYLIGVFGDADVQDLAASANRTVAVVALDDASGALAWYRPLRECAEALKLPKGGAWIARSSLRQALYVFCTQTGALGVYQGQSALVRLSLAGSPSTASSAEMATTDVSVFPIGGAYKNPAFAGVVGLDPATDRVFVQSQSNTTPGAFVFDGQLDAWIGQIPAPDIRNHGQPTSRGVDPTSGRYYIATSGLGGCTTCTTYLLSTYGRSLPLQSGSVRIFPGSVVGLITVDPVSHSVMVPFKANGAKAPTILIFKDNAPPEPPNTPENFDAGTTGTAPAVESYVFSDAASNAYGAAYVVVGGTSTVPANDNGGIPLPFSPSRGTRGLMSARLSGADLAPGGAASAGTALTGDTNTESEYENETHEPWPYAKHACLDGGGAPDDPGSDANGGVVSLTCDLAKRRVTGHAFYGRMTAGPYSTTSTEATTTITRDDKNGAQTLTHAAAHGIRIGLDGIASVSIGEVETTVSSTSKGLSGKATAAWSRHIKGLVVRGPTNAILFQDDGCTDAMATGQPRATDGCKAMVDEINRVLPDRIRFELPEPEVITTPKGAFASVAQSDADYYQARTVDDQGVTFSSDSIAQRAVPALRAIVYNDGTERSRVVAQFAAVQGSSLLQVFARNPYEPPPLPTSPPLPVPLPTVAPPAPTAPPVSDPAGPIPTPTTAPGPPVALPPGQIGVEGLSGLVRRPLGEATLLALLLGLYATAAATAWRRRRLVRSLEEVT